MNLRRSSALALALVVFLGVWPCPAGAQQALRFDPPAPKHLVVPEFADRDVDGLIAALDSALVSRQPAPSPDEAAYTLWAFVRRLQAGRLTPSQEASVLERLLAIGRAHADYRAPIEQASFMVRALTVGKTAPEAAGQDLQGNAFSLSEYRGKVVVLTFSADWCAICRTQYPYYRLMQDLYVELAIRHSRRRDRHARSREPPQDPAPADLPLVVGRRRGRRRSRPDCFGVERARVAHDLRPGRGWCRPVRRPARRGPAERRATTAGRAGGSRNRGRTALSPLTPPKAGPAERALAPFRRGAFGRRQCSG